MIRPALILHGGAWDWSDDLDAAKADALKEVACIAWHILENGGSALDAVEKATNILEDNPLFDAGTGSHLNADGVVEMDALIIDGARHDFGAVAGVRRVRHPISLARRVLEDTTQNFFVGAGADQLAQRLGVERVPNLSLVSEAELVAFRRLQIERSPSSNATSAPAAEGGHDTVGAIALDSSGNIAVATSTGGTPAKPAGRVGDSPLFGAGGYADNRFGGAGATGKGEHSMRTLLSKYVVDRIADGQHAQAASEAAMTHLDSRFDASMVGVIALDADGHPGAAHTTPKLACAWIDADGNARATMRGGVITD
jgi:beta-aspartyl-peptidase (threonine type)